MIRGATIFPFVLGLLAIVSVAAHAQDTTRRCFNGYGYTLDNGELRYVEHHEQVVVNGKPSRWYVTYYNPQGQVIATKTMDFSRSNTVPVYTFRIPRDDYVEGIDHRDGQWRMYRRENSTAERQTKIFHIAPPMAADSGFNALVQKHFQALMSGRAVHFKFAVAGHLSVIDMVAEKIGTTTFEGKQAVVFKAKLDNFFFNLFVDPLLLTYDPQTERLLEYRGIGNMHNKQGEVYPVRVSYYSNMPKALQGSDIPTQCTGRSSGQGSN